MTLFTIGSLKYDKDGNIDAIHINSEQGELMKNFHE